MKHVYFHRFMWIFLAAFAIIFSVSSVLAEPISYVAKGKRDPFVQLVASSKQAVGGLLGVESIDEIVVEGIMMDADSRNSIVVANGSVMKEGEEVGDVKLVKIQADGAVFSVNGMEEFKALYADETK